MIRENYKIHFDNYISSLQSEIEFLNKIEMPVFDQIGVNCEAFNDFDGWAKRIRNKGIDEKCSVLYYFSFAKDIDSSKILECAKKLKGIKKTERGYAALSRINSGNIEKCSGILYVGKTNSNFISRVKHHFGLVPSHTYALQLRHWASEYDFLLHFARISFEKVNIGYLEHMETALHHGLHPLLGRSGH